MNKKKIMDKVESIGYKLGCYESDIDRLNKTNLEKVLDMVDGATTDVKVCINRKPYIVEIEGVDKELDFYIISKADYEKKYGNND